MSFGFSVGDFIAVLDKVEKIRSRFVAAPSQFSALSQEVKNLSNIVRDINDALQIASNFTPRQEEDLRDISQNCQNVLVDLEKTVDENQVLEVRSGNLSSKTVRAWKRLTWEPANVAELRARISSSIGLLTAFNSGITKSITKEDLEATKQAVERLTQHQDDAQRHDIEKWISSDKPSAKQNDIFRRRQEGTGEWLLESPEYRTWYKGEKQTLFCQGIPGAGKTIMSSIVINDLDSTFPAGQSDVGIAFLYCDYKTEKEQSPEFFMASLLSQLLRRQSSLPAFIRDLYQKEKEDLPRPQDIKSALRIVVKTCSRVFIVVDALDECKEADSTRTELLDELFYLRDECGAALFTTSRFHTKDVSSRFHGELGLDIRADDGDIEKFLRGNMGSLREFIQKRPTLQEDIRTAIIASAKGMFLLAKLHLDSLRDKVTPKEVKNALERLPKGSNALNLAYDEAIRRIESQDTGIKELAKKTLSWVVHAKRQLRAAELQHALAVEIKSSVLGIDASHNEIDEKPHLRELDPDNIAEIEDILSACGGLVIIEEETRHVHLVHETTMEYFHQIRDSWLPGTDTEMTVVCLTYLSLDRPEDDPFLGNSEPKHFWGKGETGFADYAAQYWGDHAHDADDTYMQAALDFLCSKKKAKAGLPIFTLDSSGLRRIFEEDTPAFHVITYFELPDLIKPLRTHGLPINAQDEQGWTALSYAAHFGKMTMAKALLAEDGIAPDHKDAIGRTPLFIALMSQHVKLVKVFLQQPGVNPDVSLDDSCGTPLAFAAHRGFLDMFTLLLQNGANPASKNKEGRTPLLIAARGGHVKIVQALLNTGLAKMESGDKNGKTPLMNATERGRIGVVKLLLDAGSNPNTKDKYGWTALFYALNCGQLEISRLLVASKDVDTEARDSLGRTAYDYSYFPPPAVLSETAPMYNRRSSLSDNTN
ncbi:Ankyrin repeat domain-containing protein [Lachnellula suecica]|uniref:Ankyrin repeat domain-containing protein n=1 Tax=Lachnellula suecica TaxID=602035 RepID=A0A8T9CD78_9HELO|nr:Ankyrin repeat domain-containing protein [Lachnellula suecica]